MAVDQPGCALYSSFGLPVSPAFVDVQAATADGQNQEQQEVEKPTPAPEKGEMDGSGGFNSLPPMGYNTW
jgi:hypothetical protein